MAGRLSTRFGLELVSIDREGLRALRRRRGFAADPRAGHSRFSISHELLAEERWRAGLERRLGDFRPKSLLVLDEAHHAAPASGERLAVDSRFTRTIRDLARRFEHRLFLTANPHDGQPDSFSALLEMLDPERFVRGLPVRKRDLEPVAVRPLEEDLRALGAAGRGFPHRRVEPIPIDGLPEDAPELVLGRLLARFGSRGVVERLRSRACLSTAAGAERRLLFSGRLVLYGPAALRLHEELPSVAAVWILPERRRTPLRRAAGRHPPPVRGRQEPDDRRARRVSLRLETLATEHELAFLDHALVCGDGLVGLSPTPLEGLDFEPERACAPAGSPSPARSPSASRLRPPAGRRSSFSMPRCADLSPGSELFSWARTGAARAAGRS